MDINDKAKIISEFFTKYRKSNDEDALEFIRVHDLGVPLAYFLDSEYVTFVNNGWATMFVENTYDDLCDFLMCDPSLQYSNLDEMITTIDSMD